jgi:type I restriction enzyme S subunit
MPRTTKKTIAPIEKHTIPTVPAAEQPYKVPENWRWVRLGDITQIIGGGTPASGVAEYYENGDIPWISPADLSQYNNIYISHGTKNITQLGLAKSSAKLLPTDTVCLSSRAPIGYVVIAANPLSTNQGFKSFLPAEIYNSRYLYWYLKGNKELLESRASGTTFLELSASKAATIEFPLPPLAEQQRIVDRIERLFAKLDEAREKAKAVVDGFENRKAAILHKAFTGELTKRWREEQGIGMEGWKTVALEDVCYSIFDGDHMPPPKSEQGIPF